MPSKSRTRHTRPIPCEIQDAIIDQLYSDLPSLSSCSLVSKQWLSRARHWSFAEDEVQFIVGSNYRVSPSEKQRSMRFFELLHAPHSTIGFYSQSALIVGPDIIHVQQDVTGPQSDYDVLNTLLKDHLSLLPNLRTITISYISWKCLQPEAKAIISSLQRVTSVAWISICIERLTDLLNFCGTNFSDLETLKIREISVTVDGGNTQHNHEIIQKLNFLDVRVSSELNSLLRISPSPYIEPYDMHKLCFRGINTWEDAVLVGRFIEGTGPALRHIGLEIGNALASGQNETLTASFPISFERNTNLESLEISMISIFGTLWVENMITTIRSLKFKELTLWINASTAAYLGNLDLESLEQGIVNRTDLPMLRMVHLKFIQTGGFQDSDHTLAKMEVERRLSVLHGRRILSVTSREAPPSEVLDGWHPFSWD